MFVEVLNASADAKPDLASFIADVLVEARMSRTHLDYAMSLITCIQLDDEGRTRSLADGDGGHGLILVALMLTDHAATGSYNPAKWAGLSRNLYDESQISTGALEFQKLLGGHVSVPPQVFAEVDLRAPDAAKHFTAAMQRSYRLPTKNAATQTQRDGSVDSGTRRDASSAGSTARMVYVDNDSNMQDKPPRAESAAASAVGPLVGNSQNVVNISVEASVVARIKAYASTQTPSTVSACVRKHLEDAVKSNEALRINPDDLAQEVDRIKSKRGRNAPAFINLQVDLKLQKDLVELAKKLNTAPRVLLTVLTTQIGSVTI